jgi:hypothetical protein
MWHFFILLIKIVYLKACFGKNLSKIYKILTLKLVIFTILIKSWHLLIFSFLKLGFAFFESSNCQLLAFLILF